MVPARRPWPPPETDAPVQPAENSLPQVGCIQAAFVRYQARCPNSTMTAEVDREKHLSSAYGQRGARLALSGYMPPTDITREDTKVDRWVEGSNSTMIKFWRARQ